MFPFGWLQEYKSKRFTHEKKTNRYIIDESAIKIGSSELIWFWVAIIEPNYKEILAVGISKERNMFVA